MKLEHYCLEVRPSRHLPGYTELSCCIRASQGESIYFVDTFVNDDAVSLLDYIVEKSYRKLRSHLEYLKKNIK